MAKMIYIAPFSASVLPMDHDDKLKGACFSLPLPQTDD